MDFGEEYTYEISSLSDDGLEGPLSEPQKKSTPKIFKINGQLINEKGQPKIDEAKVFLYTDKNVLGKNIQQVQMGNLPLKIALFQATIKLRFLEMVMEIMVNMQGMVG